MKRWMKYFTDIGGWLTLHNCQFLLLWQILTGWMSAGNSAQQRGGSLGDSWSVWNFLSQLAREPTRTEIPPEPLFANRQKIGERCGGQNAHPGHNDRVFNSW